MRREADCARSWQAEAIEDGRLGAVDREAFERHALTCSTCANEMQELGNLRAAMEHLPEATSSPFVRRRLRTLLIERVAKDGWSKGPPLSGRLGLAATAVVLALGLLAVAFVHRRSAAPLVVAAPAEFVVEDVRLAQWSEVERGALTRVRLSAGSAAFQVRRVELNHRFLLLLPDGEIEVHGTKFLVEIETGHTEHVSVSEGVVSLRLEGQSERILHAGDVWTRFEAPSEPEKSLPPEATPAPSSESRAAESPVHRGVIHSTPSETPAEGAGRPVAAAPPPRADSFRAGVSAFEAGDYSGADASLRRFIAESPSDPRTEDASFLRAIARSRLGDKESAADLARGYLARFPAGLRRKEAERLASGGRTEPGR
jgi:hypothetical protein